MQSPDGNHLWFPSQSLWTLIAEHVTGSELHKIRTALGNSLVDMYTDIHSEAEMWYKMWQESQQRLPHQQGSPLADPPAVKELVRAEVKMLLQTLRERANIGGRDGEEFVFWYKPETVDYALGHLDSCYRSTNPEDTGDESRPNSRCSVQTNAEDEIEAVRDKLNVTDIDEVVDRLKSVLKEECEALNRLVKNLKGNIKQKRRSQCDKSEPTLSELRELRGAIQMDLQLYPSMLAASPPASSLLPLKELKSRSRLPARQRVSGETLGTLSTTSAFRPHPPPPMCHTKPRPPSGAPPSKTSVKLINSPSLSRTHGQHRSTSASSGPRKTHTPILNRITSSGPANDQIMVKPSHHSSLSPKQDSAGLHCRALTTGPSSQIKTHPSSHRTTHSSSGDLSPQTERKSSSAWRSRKINTITSSPRCDSGSYSSNSTDLAMSTTGKSKTQNGTCGGSLMSTTLQVDNDTRKSTSERFHSCVGSRKSNNGTDRNKNGHLGKDVTQQQSLLASV
ncbi:coiled-coil domain-containing protein 24 [Dicentrarchus labrax]|uniref:Coiled-coil domain-containing protein 24 n=1 Tax=Dicentrarchus labrax TaxID=13489 RepID=A0A8P4KDF3_DICLA|nr:coiled-coil domain-containing protein 24 [Dicentrarchus labrax]